MYPEENKINLREENTLSKAVRLAQNKAAYDAACKRILAEKRILAWIMKECVEEYRDCSLEEIETKYIEGTPQLGEVGVLPDEAGSVPSVPPVIRGEQSEDSTLTEGTVVYDIRFRAIAPREDGCITLLINVEGQKDYAPGYPLPKRGIYYCSRMISSQYGTEFTHAQYEKIKKVYSIWICLDPPKHRQNTITRYRLQEENLVGAVKEPRENYDLMTLVMVCLGDKEKGGSRLLQMLDVLFSRRRTQSEKRKVLEGEFNLPMTQELSEEVSKMCNFSDVVEREATERGLAKGMEQGLREGMEQGLKEGMEQGMKEGLEKGRQEEKLTTARHMKADNLDIDLICRYTGLERAVVEKI